MNPTPASSLSPVQQKVLTLLAAGVPLSHAAEQAGVSRQTIYNWHSSTPAFAQSLQDAQAEYTDTLKDKLQHLSSVALDALQQILEDPKAPAGVKLRAALAVLKRPTSPYVRGWNLPVPLNPNAQLLQEELDYLQASEKHYRLTKMDTNRATPPEPASPPEPTPQIPRSAPCPCGSGEKYKRFCGKDAPPVLHNAA